MVLLQVSPTPVPPVDQFWGLTAAGWTAVGAIGTLIVALITVFWSRSASIKFTP
jgi:hypothetical protein